MEWPELNPMVLTNRQIYIISYLLNHSGGVDAERLAAQSNISLRTLQNEIKDINDSLEDGSCIVNVGKHGYVAKDFSSKARALILELAEDRQTMIMPEKRVNDILAALIFEKDHISMEALAGKLFLSKGTVFRTIESSKVLKKIITISKTKGLRIDLPEFEKRQYLTKVFDIDSVNLYAPEVGAKYRGLDKLLKGYFTKLFVAHKYHVSGEALRNFRRYVILSIIRNDLGYELEEITHGLRISSLMEEILDGIRKVTGTSFSESEKQDLQAKLNELPTFLMDVSSEKMGWILEWEPKYQLFLDNIKETFGIVLKLKDNDKNRLLLHIWKLYQRTDVGHHISNYNKREINRAYPLATHIVVSCFEKSFGFKIPETEVTLVALYIAMGLKEKAEGIQCAIVTSKNPSLVWPMKQWLMDRFPGTIEDVSIIEHYRWMDGTDSSTSLLDMERMLILTASPTMALSCPESILVKPLELDSEFDNIDKKIRKILEKRRTDALASSIEKYVTTFTVTAEKVKSCKGLPELLKSLGEESGDTNLVNDERYEFVLDTDVLLIPHLHAENASGNYQSSIRVYNLEALLTYRGSNVHSLVISDYYSGSKGIGETTSYDSGTNTCQQEIRQFYSCIKELLLPGKIDELL